MIKRPDQLAAFVAGLLLTSPLSPVVTVPAQAAAHGNPLTPYTIGNDGWTAFGSAAPPTQTNCGTGTANTAAQCWFYVSPSLACNNSATTCQDTGNNCTNVAAPCNYIISATNQMRSGKPDHLNIKCGTTAPYNTSDVRALSFNVGGTLSQTNPAVATTYCPGLPEGSGQRATLLSDCNHDGIQLDGQAIMVTNLRLYSHNRDPVSNQTEYNPSCVSGSGISGFAKGNGSIGWLLLEGNTFEYYNGNSLTAGLAPANINNVILNRNIILGSYGNGLFSQGIVGTTTFTENIFCNSAWNNGATNAISSATYDSVGGAVTIVTNFSSTAGYQVGNSVIVSGVTGTGASSVNGTRTLISGSSGATLVFQLATGLSISGLSGGAVNIGSFGTSRLDHNWYFAQGPDYPTIPAVFPNATTFSQPITAPLFYRGNISCNGANNDQFRQGGGLQFNLWVSDPGAVSISGNIINVTDNVITEARDYPIDLGAYGNGFTVSTGATPDFTAIPSPVVYPQSITNNIFTRNNGTGNASTIFVQTGSCNPSNQDCAIASTGMTISNDLFCDWPTTTITKQSEGSILSLDPMSIVAGGGAAQGIYPGTSLTGTPGSGATAVVTIGPSGGVTGVNITQFGGVGALFDAIASGTTLTVSNMQAGGIILPNGTSFNTTLEHAQVGSLNRTIVSQTGGTTNGNGTYQLNSALSFTGAGQAVTDWPNQGASFVAGETLTIPGGNLAGQIPGLSGASIKVATVATNTYSNNTAQGTACSSLSASPPTIAAYDALTGGSGSVQDFISRALAKSKSDAFGNSNWPYALSAYAAVNYFKTGFGQTPNAPVYSP